MGKRTRKAPASAVSAEVLPSTVENAAAENSLSAAFGYPGNGMNGGQMFSGYPAGAGFPFNQNPWAPQISQASGLILNLRYYLVSNFRQVLSEAYMELGLVQTITDVPVDDALRGGIEIKSDQLSPEEVTELQVAVDRDDDLGIAGQAAKWNRLFGGAGILIITDQDPMTPLDLEAISEDENVKFRAVDMWELFWDQQNLEGFDLEDDDTVEYYNYYGSQVHHSRVLKLTGLTAPSFVRPRLRGWGFSVVEALVRSLNQYLKSTDLAFEVLDEFKLDVYKIKNLTNTLLSPIGAQKVRERMQLANWLKNYQNALVMDAEDDFDHKQLSFTGLAEAMSSIRMQVASDMRMPLTKLFGISAAGFNSGEDDIEVYNSMVESQVRAKIKYHLLKMLEIKCQKLFGFIPDDLSISFKALRVLSSEQEENVKTQKFNRAIQAQQAGLISSEEFRDIANRSDLFDVKLVAAAPALNPDDGDTVDEEPGQDGEPGADEEPGESDEVAPKAKAKAKVSGGASKARPQRARVPKDPPREKAVTKNTYALFNITPYTRSERAFRMVTNSAEFDKASYEADQGALKLPAGREHFFDRDKAHDKALWEKAETQAKKIFGKDDWRFAVWWYLKQGGKFH